MNPIPSILVIMPVFNPGPYLQPAIESILAQTETAFRFLIIDDGSTDGSSEVISACPDPRIIFRQQQKSGPGSIMNAGIQYAAAQGIPYIARMDADDISLPTRLAVQRALLDSSPHLAGCSCNCRYISTQGEPIGSSTVPLSPRTVRWEIQHNLRGMVQGAMFMRTSALQAVGGYRTQFRNAEEHDLFLRLIEHHQFTNLPEYLYAIRLHSTSLSMKDVPDTLRYLLYASDCYHRRQRGQPERTFSEFVTTMPLFTRLDLQRQALLLHFWRKNLTHRSFPAVLLASLLDPVRVLARLNRFREAKLSSPIDSSHIPH